MTDYVRTTTSTWSLHPELWEGNETGEFTLHQFPIDIYYPIVIYGELFGADVDAVFDPPGKKSCLSVETRLDYIKYCIPDMYCFEGQKTARGVTLADGTIDPLRRVLPVGPYDPLPRIEWVGAPLTDHLAVYFFLMNSQWYPAKHGKRLDIDPGYEGFEGGEETEWLLSSLHWNPSLTFGTTAGRTLDYNEGMDWKQALWQAVMWCRGFEGLKLVTGEVDLWDERFRDGRRRSMTWGKSRSASQWAPSIPTPILGWQET